MGSWEECILNEGTSMLRRSLTAALLTVATVALTGVAAAPSQAARPPSPWGDTPNKIVAIGDSFTAGFGYFDNGDWMPATDLPSCKPGDKPNDACSSNSPTRSNKDSEIKFSSDWGFANQISWTANFAWSMGVRSSNVDRYYRNFAITGSTAKEWAENELKFGRYKLNGLHAVAVEKPRIVLVTLGGNPTLSKILFGSGNKCAVPFIDKWECFKGLINDDGTEPALEKVYTRLLNDTNAIIIPVLYPEIVPAATLFTAEDLIIARNALNDSVVKAIDKVKEKNPDKAWRLLWSVQGFNTGVTKGNFSEWSRCFGPTAMGWPKVDGPSNQSVATQAVFAVTRKFTGWCQGNPWVISQDTGIHPNQEGYRQIRGAVVWRFENWPSRNRPNAAATSPVMLYAKNLDLDTWPGGQHDVRIPLAFRGPRTEATVSVYRNTDCPHSAFQDNGKPIPALAKAECDPSEKVSTQKVTLTEGDHTVTIPAPVEAGTYSVIFRGEDLTSPADSVNANVTLHVNPGTKPHTKCKPRHRTSVQGEQRICRTPRKRL